MLTDADVSFGLVPREYWVQPDWIDEGRAQEGRNKLVRQGVIYGGKFIIRRVLFSILPSKPQVVFRTCVLATHPGTISSSIISYRNMCRFNSGVSFSPCGFRKDISLADLFPQFFFRHELLAPYKWYWRVESVVHHAI